MLSFSYMEEYLTYDEAATVLKVSVTQLKRWLKQESNPLPVIYLGESTPRIKRSELDEWVARQSEIQK